MGKTPNIGVILASEMAFENLMPLSDWLAAMDSALVDIGPDHAMREWVTGLHKRGLMYHFDDCAIDCLSGTPVTLAQATTINKITKELYCEDMFVLANQLLEDDV